MRAVNRHSSANEGAEMFQDRKTSKAPQQAEPNRVVMPDDFGVARAIKGQIIESGAAGPCTLIGLVDRTAGVAILGHFVRPNDVNEDDFGRMLAESRAIFKNRKRVEVFLAGCSPECDFDFDQEGGGYGAGDAQRSRRATIQKLVQAGYSRDSIKTEWQDEVYLTQEMFIDLVALSVSIETTNMDDHTTAVRQY